MIKKLLAKLGLGAPATRASDATPLHKPYRGEHVNFLYNLLFCDDVALFRSNETATDGTVWGTLFASEPDIAALQRIAQDNAAESRLRVLAFNRLRALGVKVPPKVLLGVIVEVPFPDGLDVLAAYPDGRVRYLNRSEKVAIFEGGPPRVEALARELVATSQRLVQEIGPWDDPRLPPPRPDHVRMTFLVSDGLYLGEGPFEALQQDALGAPVIAKASELLLEVVEASTKNAGQSLS